MSIGKIIIIATSHASMGSLSSPETEATGIWFEELAVPYYEFVDAGYQVDIVSIAGGAIPIDPRSRNNKDENVDAVERFIEDEHAMTKIKTSVSIEGVNFAEYEALFFPGGHGAMWDFPNHPILADAISVALDEQRIVAAVCHGPAALVGVKDSTGAYVVKGKRVAGFTNTEEDAAGLTEQVPFLLQDALIRMGAKYEYGDDFTPFVVQDGSLITGQNPASSHLIAQHVIASLSLGSKNSGTK
ncbi:type 1 glutamine amidotransferase domain-containing protein [Glaciecola siphonariae]|uniref:Type 1 glutamine amidotransferase domain-containing protein n=1 Tax=Glaciecola siphonariae TaxID=521012 RepID=A0ABV9LX87_9ALTE